MKKKRLENFIESNVFLQQEEERMKQEEEKKEDHQEANL
jgi:hypothetical protein